MQQYSFNDIFQELPNGMLSPRKVIDINGITIGPGVSFGPGTSFGGMDFFKIRGRTLAGEEQNGILYIRGYYGTPVVF